MGFLDLGYPLDYDSILQITEKIRNIALKQFVLCMQHNYDRLDHELFFGDEVEYMIVKLNDETRKVQIALIASDVISGMSKDENVKGLPEYASYMIEVIPSKPLRVNLSSILEIQKLLNHKRNVIQRTITSLGYSKCHVLQMTSFPRLGCKDSIAYMDNQTKTDSRQIAKSIFLPDAVITKHPRFISFTKNIRLRRGAKVALFAPMFMDKYTQIKKLPDESPIAVRIVASKYIDRHDSTASSPTSSTPRLGVSLDETLAKNISKIIARGSSFHKIETVDRIELKASDCPSLDKLFYTTDICGLVLENSEDSDCEYCPFSPCEFRNTLEILNRKWVEETAEAGDDNPIPLHIYMDAMCFGMGMCCYQNTFSCPSMDDARYIHDQLLAISPYFLALTASCPIFRGFLTETDTRWNVLSQSVDDRSEKDCLYMPKSRFSCNSLYISNRDVLVKNYFKFNDVLLPTNIAVYDECVDVGVDPILARHISHIFTRDPICLFKSSENYDDKNPTDFAEFEAFQSVNWNMVRFKLPTLPVVPGSKGEIGYRVEFRCPEMQLTDFENSAVSAVLLVLTKMIVKNNLELYLPISILEENLKRSSQRSAVFKSKFYYPKVINGHYTVEEDTLYHILFGEDGLFTKCIKFVKQQVASLDTDTGAKVVFLFEKYMQLFKRRCEGQLPTTAGFIRQFVLQHELYKQDSVVSDEIAYDLCDLAISIQSGRNPHSEMLLGNLAKYN
ncbi:Glutamate--cysteine ligase [Babesia microti strain RI]|uniref:Glutamate--cysteine ligase n=1 Tax=Babesia microti (strain RI) TaxID=1133968 RepID=A0A1R4AAG9_BABMR|nr:Glutamate--cysteine ligase [Babesia microti strain RI]SJK85980.1 Glutamate--cysteine ligase [Babesia microti strain RI]|eukprot:XP_021338181.1 Glutamate--cysteine ligase [Babesia microti strain RI]